MNSTNNKKIEFLEESDFILRCCTNLHSEIDFFFGSGASKSSGIPLGQEITWMLKRDLFCSKTNHPRNLNLTSDKDKKIIQEYFDKQEQYPPEGDPKEYSFYFQEAYPEEESREKYIKDLLINVMPSDGYKYLGAILLSAFTKNVWTTNFDTLVEKGVNFIEPYADFITYGIENPPNFEKLKNEEFPCVCKLHGDFRYGKLKNISEELQSLTSKLDECFKQELIKKGLAVIGYSGSDDSIMNFLTKNLNNTDFLSKGIYWLVLDKSNIPLRVKKLLNNAANRGKKAYVVEISGFDSFFERLYTQLGISNTQIDNLKKQETLAFYNNNYIFNNSIHTETLLDITEFKNLIEKDYVNIDFNNFPNICIKLLNQKSDYFSFFECFSGMRINGGNLIYKYCDLINYTNLMFSKNFNKDSNYVLFIYGFDEVPDYLIIQIEKQLIDLLYFYENVRIILIGKNGTFIQEFEERINSKSYIVRTSNNNQINPETILKSETFELIQKLCDIDFYKQFSSDESTFFEIIKKAIDYTLIYDKQRFDFYQNLSYRQNELSIIDLKKVNECLKNISFELLAKEEKNITEEIIKDIINNSELFDFIIKSKVINYYNKNKISIIDDFIVYYYCIQKLLTKPVPKNLKLLFLKTDKVNEHYLVILYLILKTVDNNSYAYNVIIQRLKKISSVYVLLTNYKNLSSSDRYFAYNKIVNEFNHSKQLIYYARFIQILEFTEISHQKSSRNNQ